MSLSSLNFNYHALEKMKRQILQEKNRTLNRIQLYKKASERILKKKEKQLSQQLKQQEIKKDQLFIKFKKQPHQESQHSHRYMKSFGPCRSAENQKFSNLFFKVKMRKDDRKRNEIMIRKIKQKEKRKKLKSANTVREDRERMRASRQKFFERRISSVRAEINQKISRQHKQYQNMSMKLKNLQGQEGKALIQWKYTFDNI